MNDVTINNTGINYVIRKSHLAKCVKFVKQCVYHGMNTHGVKKLKFVGIHLRKWCNSIDIINKTICYQMLRTKQTTSFNGNFYIFSDINGLFESVSLNVHLRFDHHLLIQPKAPRAKGFQFQNPFI